MKAAQQPADPRTDHAQDDILAFDGEGVLLEPSIQPDREVQEFLRSVFAASPPRRADHAARSGDTASKTAED